MTIFYPMAYFSLFKLRGEAQQATECLLIQDTIRTPKPIGNLLILIQSETLNKYFCRASKDVETLERIQANPIPLRQTLSNFYRIDSNWIIQIENFLFTRPIKNYFFNCVSLI